MTNLDTDDLRARIMAEHLGEDREVVVEALAKINFFPVGRPRRFCRGRRQVLARASSGVEGDGYHGMGVSCRNGQGVCFLVIFPEGFPSAHGAP